MRLRDFGVTVGILETGVLNAITDVNGVSVGHMTMIEGDAIRTGVTALLPHSGNLYEQPVVGAVHTINGYGKAAGFEQVRELGRIETPILLTATLNVGKVADACVSYMLQSDQIKGTVNPLVGECNDGYLNDYHGRHVGHEQVFAAIDAASSGPVAEGNVGAGTGTTLYQFKGGIGTASRRVGDYTVGALLQTNFGTREELTVLGVPVGQHVPHLKGQAPQLQDDGSVMIVLATDAPLTARQLTRLAKRAAFGLARTGTVCHHGSGDFVIAFSTERGKHPMTPDTSEFFNPLFQAVVEAVEEAVYNALVAAETLDGRDGHMLYALPHDALDSLLRRYGRLT